MSTTPSTPAVSAPPPPNFLSQVKSVMQKGVDTAASSKLNPLNIARRYISNMPDLYGYDAGHINRAVSMAPTKLYSAGVKDVPIVQDTNSGAPNTTDMMRRELLRRGFGVHTPSPQDFFVQGSDKTLQMNPQLYAGSPHLGSMQARNIWHDLSGLFPPRPSDDGGALPPAHYSRFNRTLLDIVHGGKKTRQGWVQAPRASNVFSNYPLTYKGNGIYNLRDVWDFALHPHEQEAFDHHLKMLWSSSPSSVLNHPQVKTMLGRKALEAMMKDGPATFDQDFQVTRQGVVPITKKSSRGAMLFNLLTGAANKARPVMHYAAKVPSGVRFRDAPVRNSLNLLMRPYLGKYTPWVNAGTLGALGISVLDSLRGAATSVPAQADKLESMLPHFPENTGLRAWLRDISDSPGRSLLTTTVNGMPYGVTDMQKAWAKDALSLAARKAVHTPPASSSPWRKAVHTVRNVLSPLRLPLNAAVNTGFKAVVPPPRPEEVKDLAVRGVQAISPFQK